MSYVSPIVKRIHGGQFLTTDQKVSGSNPLGRAYRLARRLPMQKEGEKNVVTFLKLAYFSLGHENRASSQRSVISFAAI